MGHLLKIHLEHLNMRTVVSKSVPFRLTMVQMPKLTLLETKWITVYVSGLYPWHWGNIGFFATVSKVQYLSHFWHIDYSRDKLVWKYIWQKMGTCIGIWWGRSMKFLLYISFIHAMGHCTACGIVFKCFFSCTVLKLFILQSVVICSFLWSIHLWKMFIFSVLYIVHVALYCMCSAEYIFTIIVLTS